MLNKNVKQKWNKESKIIWFYIKFYNGPRLFWHPIYSKIKIDVEIKMSMHSKWYFAGKHLYNINDYYILYQFLI